MPIQPSWLKYQNFDKYLTKPDFYVNSCFYRVSHPILADTVRRPDKMATNTTMPKGKYIESLTFSTLNCIYANYGKLGKPSLQSALFFEIGELTDSNLFVIYYIITTIHSVKHHNWHVKCTFKQFWILKAMTHHWWIFPGLLWAHCPI